MEAQFKLGNLYYRYGLVQKNKKDRKKVFAEAVCWVRHSAYQEFKEAQFLLEAMYYFGNDGLPQSFSNAYKWINLAAHNEYIEASKALSTLEKFMSPEEIKEARKASEKIQAEIDNKILKSRSRTKPSSNVALLSQAKPLYKRKRAVDPKVLIAE